MLKLYVSSHIKIKKSRATKGLESFVEKHLVFDNPSYQSAVNYGRQSQQVVGAYISRNLYAYDHSDKYLYVTRGFLSSITNFLDKKKVKYKVVDKTVVNPATFDLQRIDTIRGYQTRATHVAIKRESGVIKMPCGAGKTITLTNVTRRLKQHTLVLVHTNFIMRQWISYFRDKYGYEPGIIQGKTWDVKEITIAMMPTLYQRKLDKKFINRWGCIIVDETHRVPAETFFRVANLFPAKYRFGATATARRSDGLTNMIFSSIGDIIYTVKAKTLAKKNYLTIPKVNLIQTGFYNRSNNYHALISAITRDKARNTLIAQNVYRNRNRFNLVLSNRIEHLENIIKVYKELSTDYELVIGKMKIADRNRIIQKMLDGKLHVIFATQLADEGLDIPNLDTVHLVYPTKADGVVEQRIGRIQRVKQTVPAVYDYTDMNIPKFRAFANNRMRLYSDLELELEWRNENQNNGQAVTEAGQSGGDGETPQPKKVIFRPEDSRRVRPKKKEVGNRRRIIVSKGSRRKGKLSRA